MRREKLGDYEDCQNTTIKTTTTTDPLVLTHNSIVFAVLPHNETTF